MKLNNLRKLQLQQNLLVQHNLRIHQRQRQNLKALLWNLLQMTQWPNNKQQRKIQMLHPRQTLTPHQHQIQMLHLRLIQTLHQGKNLQLKKHHLIMNILMKSNRTKTMTNMEKRSPQRHQVTQKQQQKNILNLHFQQQNQLPMKNLEWMSQLIYHLQMTKRKSQFPEKKKRLTLKRAKIHWCLYPVLFRQFWLPLLLIWWCNGEEKI